MELCLCSATVIGLHMLTYSCPSKMKPITYVILTCSWIWFAAVLLRIFASMVRNRHIFIHEHADSFTAASKWKQLKSGVNNKDLEYYSTIKKKKNQGIFKKVDGLIMYTIT